MNKKIKKLLIEIGIIVVVALLFVCWNRYLFNYKENSLVFLNDCKAYAYQVEKIYSEGENVVISGWFINLVKERNVMVENYNKDDWGVVLYDLNSKQVNNATEEKETVDIIPLSIEKERRFDINEYFKCEYDYSKCGFKAYINIEKIDFNNGQYQIVFKPNVKELYGIDTNTYIDCGKLVFCNPHDAMALNVEDTDLKSIIEKGYCVVSCPDYHICVYQYNRKLYWIADKMYAFEDDGSTFIQYHLETTQFDKLPQERINNKWFWSNIGSEFESFEITDQINCGAYRVSVRDIPTDYSVTSIFTGYYNGDELVWGRTFSPILLYKD